MARLGYSNNLNACIGPKAGQVLLRWKFAGLLALLALLLGQGARAQVAIEDISFVSLPGERVEIELGFNQPPPEPEVFVIENPARLALDFPGVASRLDTRRYPLDFDQADSVMVLDSTDRTRVVVNLREMTGYASRIQGNRLVLTLGREAASTAASAGALAAAASGSAEAAGEAEPSAAVETETDVRAVDFRTTSEGGGQIIIELADSSIIGDVNRVGSRLELELVDAQISPEQQMRLDVTDFATPVQFVDVYEENGSAKVVAEVEGAFDYTVFQNAEGYVLSITPLSGASGTVVTEEPDYSGERISLNFQDIDVRSVLQILADFNDFSLVVSDNVSGNITLRLEEVPWDQALDLVLRARELDSRLEGSVLYVAPAEQIASNELQQLENRQQSQALAPLQTDYIEINYAVAEDLLPLLEGDEAGGGILSERGRARVDQRTNTLIVHDVAVKLAEVRNMVSRLDIPVRQVLIEARIVNASTSFSDALGVRWGGAQVVPDTGDQFILGGSRQTTSELSGNIAAYNQALAEAVLGGQTFDDALAVTPRPTVDMDNALAVDLGVQAATSSFALGYLGNNGLLELELSALESSGNGEVIAQPKVATQDKQLARIESGVQVPYQAQAGGTAGGSTTEFIPALLSLEVTPQVTPDGRIIMQLDIHQDSVTPTGGQGSVPAIATNAVSTRVLVNDGETVVLGGVFREELTTQVSKTPLLGDIPYLGNLFKRTENTENKTELLIFITPSILDEGR